MKTDEEMVDMVLGWAEAEKKYLSENEFRPKMLFYVGERERTIMFPIFNAETRPKMIIVSCLIASAIDELTAIGFVSDSYTATAPKKDGTPWGIGGMQHAWENDTEDKESLSESLMYTIREGDEIAIVSLPYVRGESDEITFHPENSVVHRDGREGELDGFIVKVINAAYGAPKIINDDELRIAREEMGLTDEIARIHMLAMSVKMAMKISPMMILVPTYSDTEAEILRAYIDEGPLSEGIKSFDQDQVQEIAELQEIWEESPSGP